MHVKEQNTKGRNNQQIYRWLMLWSECILPKGICWNLNFWLLATPWTVAEQVPLCMEFSRKEYWSGLLFPSPGDLTDPEIEPGSLALQADSLLSEPPGKTFWNTFIKTSSTVTIQNFKYKRCYSAFSGHPWQPLLKCSYWINRSGFLTCSSISVLLAFRYTA